MAAKKTMDSVQTLNAKNTFSRAYLVNAVTVRYLDMLERNDFKLQSLKQAICFCSRAQWLKFMPLLLGCNS